MLRSSEILYGRLIEPNITFHFATHANSYLFERLTNNLPTRDACHALHMRSCSHVDNFRSRLFSKFPLEEGKSMCCGNPLRISFGGALS